MIKGLKETVKKMVEGEEKKPIMLPLTTDDIERIKKHMDKKAVEHGGPNYLKNQELKKQKRKGMIKVIGHFYNPIQGKNVVQVRLVKEDSIDDRDFNILSEGRSKLLERRLKRKKLSKEIKNESN